MVLCWLLVFVLPMLALDSDLPPGVQMMLAEDDGALAAIAAGYTFYVLTVTKDR
jgi:hypothetical protein